jgi:hypothetical protein
LDDAVEKVRSMPPTRNNRIKETDFLNRSCAFDAGFESMLLGDPSQNPFSTVSDQSGQRWILTRDGLSAFGAVVPERFDNTSLTTLHENAPHGVSLINCTRHLTTWLEMDSNSGPS